MKLYFQELLAFRPANYFWSVIDIVGGWQKHFLSFLDDGWQLCQNWHACDEKEVDIYRISGNMKNSLFLFPMHVYLVAVFQSTCRWESYALKCIANN